MKTAGNSFLIFGIFFILTSGFIVFTAIIANSNPPGMVFLTFAMAVMCFCLSYLHPQFIQKDERMNLIRQKGMLASFVAMFEYFIIFLAALQFDFISMSADYLSQIFAGLMICTVFISFVIYSKIY